MLADDYYLLKKGVPSPAPTRVATSSFTPDLDLVGDLIKPEYGRSIATLASTASGLKLSFDSNREPRYFVKLNFTHHHLVQLHL